MFTPGLAVQQGAGGAGYFAPPVVGGGGMGQPQVPAAQAQPQVQGYAGGYAGVQGVTEGMRGLGVGDKVSWRVGESASEA